MADNKLSFKIIELYLGIIFKLILDLNLLGRRKKD